MSESCLLRRIRSCFWARCSSTLALFQKFDCVLRSFFKTDAIIESSMSKSRKSCCLVIDRDVISSSIDFAISTSLNQSSRVIWGSAVRRTSSVLNSTFQLWNAIESGNFPRFHSEIEFLWPIKPLWKKIHQYYSTFHFYFGSEVIESTNSTILFSFHSLLAVSETSRLNPWEKGSNSSNCWRSWRIIFLEQVVVQKRFL